MTELLTPEALEPLEEFASRVQLPADPETRRRLALQVIASPRCIAYREPGYAAAAIAAFALGQVGDPRFTEGEVLLKASLVQGALD